MSITRTPRQPLPQGENPEEPLCQQIAEALCILDSDLGEFKDWWVPPQPEGCYGAPTVRRIIIAAQRLKCLVMEYDKELRPVFRY